MRGASKMKREQLSQQQKADLEAEYPGHTVTLNARGELDIIPRAWSSEQLRAEIEAARATRIGSALASRADALDMLNDPAA